MNFLDKLIEAISPERAVKRAAARHVLPAINPGYGNYGANTWKKSMMGWLSHGGSAKEDIEDNIVRLRERSRDAYMGIPIAAALLKTKRTNVIAGGLMPAPKIDAEFLGLTRGPSFGSSLCGRIPETATQTAWRTSTGSRIWPIWDT